MKEEEKVEYHNLINKFFDGEISDSEIILLKSLLERNPEYRRIFNEENELWQEVRVHTKLKLYNTDTGWLNISSGLGLEGNNSRTLQY